MKRVLMILIIALLFLPACTKKASVSVVDYDYINEKIENKDSFVLAIINDHDKDFKSFNSNIKKIVKDYNINVYYVKDSNKINDLFEYDNTPLVIFINDGEEVNLNNRIVGNISYSRMIEIFKNAEYID